MPRILKIGSRRSALAKLQSYLVAQELKKKYPDLAVEFVFKESMGDKDLVTPLWQMGDRGVFTKDFVEDLLQEKVDVVIHSWKDLDLKINEGTQIISVLSRRDQRDLLLIKKSAFLQSDFPILQIFSSSPRREYNLQRFLKKALPLRLQKEIEFSPVRGNISTRLKKWMDSSSHGIIVAKAALDRLLSEDFPESANEEYAIIRKELREVLAKSLFMCLPLSENPNAPAQGALVAEVKVGRNEILEIIQSISDPLVQSSVGIERKILSEYGGGCHQKIGVASVAREFGQITWLKGQADDGRILDGCDLQAVVRHPKAMSSDKIWPLKRSPLEFAREGIEHPFPEKKDIWVARKDAWLDHWQQTDLAIAIWASGLKTMYELAKKDIWVNGSADSLGENESPDIDILLGRKSAFVKITHTLSGDVQSDMARFYTYNLTLKSQIPDLSDKTHFFWMSGHQFDLVFKKNPGIASAFHSSGPGITRDHIASRLGMEANKNVLVDVFLNYEDWLKYHTNDHREKLAGGVGVI